MPKVYGHGAATVYKNQPLVYNMNIGDSGPNADLNQSNSHSSFDLVSVSVSGGTVVPTPRRAKRSATARPTFLEAFRRFFEPFITWLWIIPDNDILDMIITHQTSVSGLFEPLVSNPATAGGSTAIFVSSVFASILEDVMTQLWILERCNSALALTRTMSDIDHLKACKYGVYNINDVKDELDGIDPKKLNCTIYKIKKLEADRRYVNTVMTATYFGLTQTFNFDPLVSYISAFENRERYKLRIAEEENTNKMLRKEMSKRVRQQRNHIKSVLYDTEAIITKLKTDVEDSVLYAEVRSRYTVNWQVARTEQHNQTIHDVEYVPSSMTEYYKQRTDHEIRVHSEVETLVTITINEKLQTIEEWMDKFDRDMEKIDLKIQVKKNEYDDMRDKREKYEEMLEKHGIQMKEWIHFKEEREKARIYHEKMLSSAIIVQAWWRGLLVRLNLGPYKKDKKKGKKGKDKK